MQNDTLMLAHFLSKKACNDAVTSDNAKIFPQLVSKSRGLAKISERRLQPLSVQEIVD